MKYSSGDRFRKLAFVCLLVFLRQLRNDCLKSVYVSSIQKQNVIDICVSEGYPLVSIRRSFGTERWC